MAEGRQARCPPDLLRRDHPGRHERRRQLCPQRHAGVRRHDRHAGVALEHRPVARPARRELLGSRRVPLRRRRDVEQRCRRREEQAGDHRHRQPGPVELARPRHEPLDLLARRARRLHRRVQVGLPDRASRQLGLGSSPVAVARRRGLQPDHVQGGQGQGQGPGEGQAGHPHPQQDRQDDLQEQRGDLDGRPSSAGTSSSTGRPASRWSRPPR